MTIDLNKDVRKDGTISQITRRLLGAEEWIRTHKARRHQVDADLYGGKSPPIFATADMFIWSTATNINHDTAQNYAFYLNQVAPANGQYGDLGTYFPVALTYTVSVLGVTTNNSGKLDWTLDGVSVGGAGVGQDWYSVGTVYNSVKTFSLTVSSIGYHKLRFTINGKSGASYYFPFTKLMIVPASY
jgi:hypothetical protein